MQVVAIGTATVYRSYMGSPSHPAKCVTVRVTHPNHGYAEYSVTVYPSGKYPAYIAGMRCVPRPGGIRVGEDDPCYPIPPSGVEVIPGGPMPAAWMADRRRPSPRDILDLAERMIAVALAAPAEE